jgi:hypothetical protein
MPSPEVNRPYNLDVSTLKVLPKREPGWGVKKPEEPQQPNPAEQQARERLGKPPPFPSKRLSKDQIRRFELAQKSVSAMMDQRYQKSVDRILRLLEKKKEGIRSSTDEQDE